MKIDKTLDKTNEVIVSGLYEIHFNVRLQLSNFHMLIAALTVFIIRIYIIFIRTLQSSSTLKHLQKKK